MRPLREWLRPAVETALVTLIALVAVTGLSLSFTYSPSLTHAWSSVAFLERAVPLGALVRALHHDASHLLVGLGLLYLGALALSGFARREPKAWIGRVAMGAVVIGLAHTGLLLPADGRAMAAAHELLSIAGSAPLVGGAISAFIRGGPTYGHLTLVHLNALHTLVLPIALGLCAWGLKRVAAARPEVGDPRLEAPKANVQAAVVLVTVLAAILIARLFPAPLWAPGDPTHAFPARPEWFLVPIFQLRRHLGSAEALATLGIPPLLLLGAVALTRSSPAIARAFVGIVGLGFVALLVGSIRQDRQDKQFAHLRADAELEAHDAIRLAALGLSEGGPLTWDRNDPVVYGRHLFAQHCSVCHHDADELPYQGDLLLQGYGSRAWLDALLAKPRSPYFFGNGKIDGMDDVPPGPHRTALVEFLVSLGRPTQVDAALAQKGQKLFDEDGCASCHSVDGKGGNGAPDLLGYGTAAWLTAFVRDPGHERFYGEDNAMRRFTPDRLGDGELQAVVAYVQSRASEPLNIPVTAAVQSGKVRAEESLP